MPSNNNNRLPIMEATLPLMEETTTKVNVQTVHQDNKVKESNKVKVPKPHVPKVHVEETKVNKVKVNKDKDNVNKVTDNKVKVKVNPEETKVKVKEVKEPEPFNLPIFSRSTF